MDYKSIDVIYSANVRFREEFFEVIDSLTENDFAARPDGEKWSIGQVAEHVSIVDEGMSKICRKLLYEARESGLKAGGITVSSIFREYTENPETVKLEAPERVQPTRGQTIAESRTKVDSTRVWFEEIRPLFEEFDGTQPKFPHPFFGPLSAQDWLVMAGEHMRRHTLQIKRILKAIKR